MKCQACGAENRINALYCDDCGAEIEHDLSQVQASVDAEIRSEKRKAAAQSIRWLLGVSLALFVVGFYFRRAYKDLPSNDVVAFVAAPTVQVGKLEVVGATDIGVPLPKPQRIPPPRPTPPDGAVTAQLADEAFKRALVSVRHKSSKESVQGLLVGDLVLHVTPPGQKQPIAIHIADVHSLRPVGGSLWEIGARGLDKPLQAPIPGTETARLRLLRRSADGKITIDAIPFTSLVEIKPL